VPELPDLTVYLEALERHVGGRRLERIELRGIALLRSVEPPLREAAGRRVLGFRRLGKRLVLGLEGDLFLVIHLMIAGRLRWRGPEARTGGRDVLAAFHFENGTLLLSEASRRRRATLHLVRGEVALREHDRGGIEVMDADPVAFRAALARESHTLKRALTDPRLFAGIGNAYSDEILHSARLAPTRLTQRLSDEEAARLFDAVRATLAEWTARLRAEVGDGFPEKVTAFREGMAVHGRFGEPCPACGSPVQRIVHAENESNYCATCQTGGRLLADRALSRLLRADWPRTLEELEERLPGRAARAASRRKEGAR
jgi:formamidopyrimidine-DNA glycosylase